MNEIVNTFKNNAGAGYGRKKKNGLDLLSGMTPKQETEQQPAQDQTSKALASSQKQNIQQNTNAGANLNAQIAQNEYNKAVAQQQAQAAAQAQQAQQQNQQTVQQPKQDDDGWKKYYDEAFKKERDSMNFFDRLLDNGQASKRAEVIARNKYASELINEAYDDDGNVKNQAIADKAKAVANYNTDVARQASAQSQAISNTIGASKTSDTYGDNAWNNIRNTFNAIRLADLGSAVVGPDDTTKFEAADVGRFLVNLLPQAVPYLNVAYGVTRGLPTFTEAVAGYGKDSETGNYKKLDLAEILGKGASGVIDVIAPFFGGSGDLMKTVGGRLFSKGAEKVAKEATKNVSTSALKAILKSFVEEGSEEGIQQAAEFFGDGNKLITQDGQFDGEAFKDLVSQSGKAALLGGISGSMMQGANIGLKKAFNKIDAQANNKKLSTTPNAGNVNENIDVNENVETNTDINENVETQENVDANPKPKNAVEAAKINLDEKITALKNTTIDVLNPQQNAQLNNSLQGIVNQLNDGKITPEQATAYIDNLQKRIDTVIEQNKATNTEESATGQPVNPNEVTAVENAQGTQAADGVSNTVNDTVGNTVGDTVAEQQGMQTSKELGEGMAQYGDNAFELGKKNLDKGVELVEGFEIDPQGYFETAVSDNIPIAYDYSTGEYLYFADDVYSALDKNGGVDVNGLKIETPSARETRLADESARKRWEADRDWNESLKQQRLNNEISQYDYEQQLALPNSKKAIEAYGKYYDPQYIKTLGITGDYGDSSIPPIWGNYHRGPALEVNSVNQLNNMVDTATNFEPEPIPADAYEANPVEQLVKTATEPVVENTTDMVADTQGTRYEYDYANTASQYKGRLDNTGMTPELLQKIYTERYNATKEKRQANLNSVLTPSEQKIAMDFFNEVAKGSKDSASDMYNGAYVTAQNEGTDYQDRALLELVNTGQLKDIYTNYQAMVTPENFDASGNATVDYMIRRDKPDMLIKSAAQDLATDINPDATAEQVDAASNDIADAVKDLNTTAENSKENGIGDKEVKSIKPADKLSEAGKKLGIQKTVIEDAPRGLSDDVRLKNLKQWNSGAYFGVFQNLNAYANEPAANVDTFIQNRLESLTDKQRKKVLDSRAKRMQYFTEKFGDAKVAEYMTNRAMLKDALGQNLIGYAMRTQFTNQKTRDLMNEYTARYMLQDRYTQTMAQKVASVIQRVMNSSFRGMRVATTLNEIPEIVTSMADYKTLHTAKPGECQAIKAKYGMAQGGSLEQVLKTMDKADAKAFRAELDAAQDTNQAISVFKKWGNKIGKSADSIDTATQWNGFIQDWKDATFLKNAEAYYTAQNLSGFELKQRVLNDFEARMLPMSRVFKILKTDPAITKPLAMYVDSSLRLTRKAVKGAVGLNTAGVNENMGYFHRAARNAALDLLPRAISAMVMGVPLASVLGLFQVGGEDYSGISDEEKNELDVVVNFVGQLSPILSLGANYYNAYRQEQIGVAQRGDDYTDNRGDWVKRGTSNLLKTVTPLGNRLDQDFGIFGNANSTFGNAGGIDPEEFEKQLENSNMTDEEKEKARQQNLANLGVLRRGFGENKEGRVQYLAPENPIDTIRALIGGANRTSNAREYNNNPDLLSSIINQAKGQDNNGDGVVDGGFGEFFTENQALNSQPFDLNLKNDDAYNRPASNSEQHDYDAMIKNAQTPEEQREWYNKSRQYNAILDNLRVNDKEAYDVYQDQYNNNYVTPERWKTVLYGKSADGQPDLTVWNTMKELALTAAKDFNKAVDPAYTDLDDEQTRRYLQYKATATGEDTALSKIMKTDPFWKEFYKKQQNYYKENGSSDFDDSDKTERVQRWNDLNTQMSNMYKWDGINSDDPEEQQAALRLQMTYPTMYAYNSLKTALQQQYGDDYKSAPEYKAFWSDYGDAYNAESDAYNQEMLYIINQMRTIEGYDELTLDELEAINGIGTSTKSSSSGSGSSSYSYVPYFENIFNADPVYTTVRKAGGYSYKPAKGINFYDVPMSSSNGNDQYASVV